MAAAAEAPVEPGAADTAAAGDVRRRRPPFRHKKGDSPPHRAFSGLVKDSVFFPHPAVEGRDVLCCSHSVFLRLHQSVLSSSHKEGDIFEFGAVQKRSATQAAADAGAAADAAADGADAAADGVADAAAADAAADAAAEGAAEGAVWAQHQK